MNNYQAKSIESHTKIGNDYLAWEWTANALIKSAKILRREREKAYCSNKELSGLPTCPPEYLTEEVELMLQAFAIECLLKGLYVKDGNKIIINGKYNGVGAEKPHDIEILAKQVVKDNIPKTLEIALRKLKKIAISVGRYPVAKNHGVLKFNKSKNDLGHDIDSILLTQSEQSVIDTFIKGLFTELRGR